MKRLLVVTEIKDEFIGLAFMQVPDASIPTTLDFMYVSRGVTGGFKRFDSLTDSDVSRLSEKLAAVSGHENEEAATK